MFYITLIIQYYRLSVKYAAEGDGGSMDDTQTTLCCSNPKSEYQMSIQ